MHQYLLGSLRVCLVEEKLEGWKKGIKFSLAWWDGNEEGQRGG